MREGKAERASERRVLCVCVSSPSPIFVFLVLSLSRCARPDDGGGREKMDRDEGMWLVESR